MRRSWKERLTIRRRGILGVEGRRQSIPCELTFRIDNDTSLSAFSSSPTVYNMKTTIFAITFQKFNNH